MLSSIYVVCVVLILFGVSIFVHELGHFMLARWCGLVIDVFSIGFGPAIWKRKRGGITYKIGWIPFGGYVSLPQLDPNSMAVVQGKEPAAEGAPPRRVLPPIAAWRKIVVSVAGASGNLVLAVVFAWVVYMFGKPAPGPEGLGPVIGYVDTNSAAYAQGLRAGDEIVKVNGETVPTWQQFAQLTALSEDLALEVKTDDHVHALALKTAKDQFGLRGIQGVEIASVCRVVGVQPGWSADKAGVQSGDIVRTFDGVRVGSNRHLVDLVNDRADRTVPMMIDRNGKPLEVQVTPKLDPSTGRARIGIRFDMIGLQFDEMIEKTPWEQIRYDATAIVRMLRALVTPKEAKQAAEGIGGPPMILATLWVVVKVSLIGALSFTRFLNVNLAILNLLPIPVLDGGHVMFALWEGVTRRRVSPKVVNALVNFFAVLFIALFLFLTYRDIGRLINIRRILNADSATNAVPAQVSSNAVSGVATGAPPVDTNAVSLKPAE